jgi:hypothetical protein
MATETKRTSFNWLTATIIFMVLVVLAEVAAWPVGDFPLNDDWSYAVGVKNLLDTGKLTITAWTLAGAFFSVLSAALCCKIFGFSFDVLRSYNFSLGLGGLAAVGFLCRNVGASWPLTLFALITLFSDPLYFSLSNTYMMDVQTAALMTAGAAFLVASWKADSKRKPWLIAAGVAASTIAVSNRQVTVILPISYLLFAGLAHLLRRRTTNSIIGPDIKESILPLLTAGIVIAAHSWWILNVTGVPFCMTVEKAFLAQKMSTPIVFALEFFYGLVRQSVYMGLLLLPLSCVAAPRLLLLLGGKASKLLTMITIELMLLLPIGLLASKNIMPLADNVIFNLGLGPLLMYAAGSGNEVPEFAKASALFWQTVTVFSGVGLALLLGCLTSILILLKRRLSVGGWEQKHSVVALLLLFSVIYTVSICFRGFFDRYFILLLIPYTVILSFNEQSDPGSEVGARKSAGEIAGLIGGLVAAAALAFYSVAGTRDYFAWNRARWTSLNQAVNQEKTDPALINGGNEFNYWYIYEPGNKQIDVTKNDERHGNDKFVVALQPLKGYKIFRKTEFDSVLWGPGHAIYYQEKLDSNQLAPAEEASDTRHW